MRKFVFGFLGYLFLSYAGVVLTSGGWMTVIHILYTWMPFVTLAGFVMLAAVAQHGRGHNSVSFRTADLLALLTVQTVLLLTNVGDCGDAGGMVFFIERIIIGGNICRDGGITIAWLNTALESTVLLMAWTYAITLVYLSVRIISRATAKATQPRPLLPVRIYAALLVGCLIATFGWGSYQHRQALRLSEQIGVIKMLQQNISEESCEKIEAMIASDRRLSSFAFSCWAGVAKQKRDSRYCQKLFATGGMESVHTCEQRMHAMGIDAPPLDAFDDCPGIAHYEQEPWFIDLRRRYGTWEPDPADALDACLSASIFLALVPYPYEKSESVVLNYDFTNDTLATGPGAVSDEPHLPADRFGNVVGDTIELYKGSCLSGYYDIRQNLLISSGQECT